MKPISKFFNLFALVLLALLLAFQGIQPARAVAPDQAITVNIHAPANAAYGESFTVAASADSGLEVTYSAAGNCANVGATFTMTSGSGFCTVQYDQGGDITYNPATQVTESVTAQPAAITVTADAKSKQAGDPDPALTYSITSGALVGSDAFTGELARDPGETPGDYAIIQSTLALTGDYDLSFIGANLTITAALTATPTVTPTDAPATETPTASPTPIETATPTETATSPATATPTVTATPTITPTPGAPAFYVSPTGNDSNACNSVNFPCLTINGALGKAAAGDTIKVAVGTYTGSTWNDVVSINKNVTLLGGWNAGFTNRDGQSIIDGQNSGENGINVLYGVTASLSQVIVQNSDSGIYNQGSLTLNRVALIHNGNGISNYGNIDLINSTISGNHNTGIAGNAITNLNGTVTIQYSTITNNSGNYAIYNVNGRAYIEIGNSILAGNESNHDCATRAGHVISTGYNIFSSSHPCVLLFGGTAFVPAPTDQIVTDLQLGPLEAAGYHRLITGSPAIDHANSVCPLASIDQRGVQRPQGAACDVGAYEWSGHTISGNAGVAGVELIYRDDVDRTTSTDANGDYSLQVADGWSGIMTPSKLGYIFSPASIDYSSAPGPVTSDLTAQDYIATRTGYVISGNAGVANAQLSYHDGIDKIVTTNSSGNYEFAVPPNWSGTVTPSKIGYRFSPVNQAYIDLAVDLPAQNYIAYSTIPTPLSPGDTITTSNPIYQWSKVVGATYYQYQLWNGTKLIYSKIVGSNICGSTTCSSKPPDILSISAYQWKVRAMINGKWMNFSADKSFTVTLKIGYWYGYNPGMWFHLNVGPYISRFTIYVNVKGCLPAWISYNSSVYIVNNRFSFTGSLYANGVFDTATSAHGTFGLNKFYLPHCGRRVSGGPVRWEAVWTSAHTPSPFGTPLETSQTGIAPLLVAPQLDNNFGPYTAELVAP